jgi:hypothetical protein
MSIALEGGRAMTISAYQAMLLLFLSLALLIAASAGAVAAGILGSVPDALGAGIAFVLSLFALGIGLERLNEASSAVGRSD